MSKFKKILSFVLVLLVASSLSAVEFSFGGALGTSITQGYDFYSVKIDDVWNHYPYKTLKAKPVFELAADFSSGSFGIQAGTEFNFFTDKEKEHDTGKTLYVDNSSASFIYINPYYSLKRTDWTFSLGPVIGVNFINESFESNDPYYDDSFDKYSIADFICGLSLCSRYSLNERLSAYITVPVLFYVGNIYYKAIENGKEIIWAEDTKGFGIRSNVFVTPKIGVMYKF